MTTKVQTDNPYEKLWGYSRATRRGQFIFVSGTTAVDLATGVVPSGLSAYDQAKRIFAEICKAVEALGGSKEDVTRVRMFVTEADDFPDVGRALKEVFGEVGPAATGIIGAHFVSADMKVEIEADAVVLPWFFSFYPPMASSGYQVLVRKRSISHTLTFLKGPLLPASHYELGRASRATSHPFYPADSILLDGCPEIPYAAAARKVGNEISALADMPSHLSLSWCTPGRLTQGSYGLSPRRHGFE
ncbi:hypothetical protein QCA50_011351 [Cerrena zonata]|uniref:YjgF-like protein n=1 Tax=Cerrena zonata TaxID=2478898 RepID=A0AAW0G1V9_9APHY